MSPPGSNGNKETQDRLCRLEEEVGRCSQRLHLVERDVCSHSLEAAQEARQTREAVESLRTEFARFAASVAECLNKVRDMHDPKKRRWLERWIG